MKSKNNPILMDKENGEVATNQALDSYSIDEEFKSILPYLVYSALACIIIVSLTALFYVVDLGVYVQLPAIETNADLQNNSAVGVNWDAANVMLTMLVGLPIATAGTLLAITLARASVKMSQRQTEFARDQSKIALATFNLQQMEEQRSWQSEYNDFVKTIINYRNFLASAYSSSNKLFHVANSDATDQEVEAAAIISSEALENLARACSAIEGDSLIGEALRRSQEEREEEFSKIQGIQRNTLFSILYSRVSKVKGKNRQTAHP